MSFPDPKVPGTMLTQYAEFLEREAGHVTLSLIVLAIATIGWAHGMPGAEALAGLAGGWLGRSMGSK